MISFKLMDLLSCRKFPFCSCKRSCQSHRRRHSTDRVRAVK